ncbi:MAG TPA: response regulator [Candidatus Wujingus californicus]|uniref:response regulator n=1 Tax=Candidatus Wunengus californicus TaxID=3367619 RepID=UPI00402865D6
MVKPKLLLVDDNKNTLDGLVKILQGKGYQVSGVMSGCDALKILSREKFDIVITDLNMPGMSGLSLIREIKKLEEPIFVVVITADSSFELSNKYERKELYDYYLRKPVNIGELKSVLEMIWNDSG